MGDRPDTIALIVALHRALVLTKKDAERDGFKYGQQSTCQKALDAFAKFEPQSSKHDGTDCILVTVQELNRLRHIETMVKEAHALVDRQKATGNELFDDVGLVYVALGELQDAVEKCTL